MIYETQVKDAIMDEFLNFYWNLVAERNPFAFSESIAERMLGEWRLVHQNWPRCVSNQSYTAT